MRQKKTTLEHHETLWYGDGNVILVTGNLGFRVHKSILARKSEVMNDLFSLANPAEDEQFEDCPIVRLSDGPALLSIFLHRIYGNQNETEYVVLSFGPGHGSGRRNILMKMTV